MNSLPQPEKKVQPIRLIAQREAHRAEAEAGGVEDLVEFRAFYCDDILLYGAVAGPEDGVPLVLLHGFPDFWLGWAPLIRPFVEAGHRVIIPDQRGYNFSEKPGHVEDYQLHKLGDDIVALLDANELEKAHLVGHDWGGAVSWWLAENRPERFESVTILNCTHPRVLADALKFQHAKQIMRSWYIAFFQLPYLPERVALAKDCRMLVKALGDMSKPEAFSEQEIDQYKKAWSREGALTAMLNWYRAARQMVFSTHGESSPSPTIDIPLRVIWGKQDPALDASLVEPSVEHCTAGGQIHWFENAGHWVHRDRPKAVSELLLDSFEG